MASLAAVDDAYIVLADQSLIVPSSRGVLANDAMSTSLSALLLTDVGHGSLQLTGTGSFTYVPVTGFSGVDTFTYQSSDGAGATVVAQVSIHVVPIVVGATTTLNLVALSVEEQIAATYVAFFGRGADADGFEFWVNEFTVGSQTQSPATLFANIASSFGISEEARGLYPFLANPLSASDVQIGDFLHSVYDNLFGRVPDAGGIAYWTGQVRAALAEGRFVGSVLVDIISGAQNTPDGQDITTLMSRVAVGLHYVHEQQRLDANWTPENDGADASALIHGVTSHPEAVLAGIVQANALVANSVDHNAPAAPAVLGFSDNSGSSGDGLTNDTTPTLMISAEHGAVVTVHRDGVEVGIASETSTDGTFTFTSAMLADGTYEFTATATDTAENTSALSAVFGISIDHSTPVFSSGATAPSIEENSGPGQIVYDADASEVAPGGGPSLPMNYSLGGADAEAFSIDGSTGEVKLIGNPNFRVKSSYTFEVTATDAAGNATTQAVTLAIGNVNDAPTGVVSIAGSAVEDQVLTASHTLGDADGLGSVNYQWQHDTGGGFVDIAGATGATYVLGDSDVGKTITVVVSYTDGQGFAESVTSAATAVVTAFNDGAATATIGGTAQEDQELSASLGADPDGAATGVHYQWKSNGANVGIDQATYVLGDSDVGKTITVVVSYTDGQGFAESVTSAATGPVGNVNDAPTITGDITLTATSISFTAVDPDDGTLALASPIASAFGNPTISNGAATILVPAQQASAISGTLQVTDGDDTGDVVGLYLGTGDDDTATAPSSVLSNAIYGFDGHDTLVGSSTADTITGGAGGDTFVIGAVGHIAGDTIDGTLEANTWDTLRLDAAGAYDLSGFTTITNIDRILLNDTSASFALIVVDSQVSTADFDADGLGGDLEINSNDTMTKGVLINGSGLTGLNHLIVNGNKRFGGDDTITGGGGADSILTGGGNDTINLADGAFAAGEMIQGGSGTDTIALTNATTVDFSTGMVFDVETLTGTTAIDTVTMSATQWTSFTTIDLGAIGANTLNVLALGVIDDLDTPTVSNVGTGYLSGTSADDSISLTGAQLDAIIRGAGTINLGGGTADSINLASTSADLNTLGATDTSIQGVEMIAAGLALAAVTITLSGQTESFTIYGSRVSDTADIIRVGSGSDTIFLATDTFAAGELIDGGSGVDAIVLTGPTVLDPMIGPPMLDFTIGTVIGVETLTGSVLDDPVTMLATQWVNFTTIDLGAGTNVLNVVASGDISALNMPSLTNINIGNLMGTSGNDSVTLTGIQLDAILIGPGVIDLGAGTIDRIYLTSTSVELNALGGTDAAIQGVEHISAKKASIGVIVNLLAQTERFAIEGSLHPDVIVGGVANDEIGGAMNDILLDGGGGSDVLYLAEDFASVSDGQISRIETVSLNSAIVLDLSNQTEGFAILGSGDTDTITGGSGADRFIGALSAAALDGGNNVDTLYVQVNFTTSSNGQISNIEKIELVAAVTLDISSQTEGFTIIGSTGDDNITGGSGADSVSAGAGNDTIVGTAGDTLLDGGNDTDTLQVGANFTSSSDGQIIGIENVTLTAAAVLVLTNQTEGFTITGSAGADSITGGGGNDTIVGAANDTLLAGGSGTDTLQVGANFASSSDGQITGVENVTLTAPDVLSLFGQTEGFTINGSGGADTIVGGSGADSVNAGAGNDVIVAGQNDTLLDGGNDTDELEIQENFTSSSDAQIANVENVRLTTALTVVLANQTEGFSISGSSGADSITGGAGVDVITGGAGVDIIRGGNGADSISVGPSDDNLRDAVVFGSRLEFGDSILNFDTTGSITQVDVVRFLMSEYDDIIVDGLIGFAIGDGVDGGNTALDFNISVEVLLIYGENSEGVLSSLLSSAADIAAELNSEFSIFADVGESAILIVNDTDGNEFAIWDYVESAGATGTGSEISASELTLIGVVSGNGTVDGGCFSFV